jgi:hypothetical protein
LKKINYFYAMALFSRLYGTVLKFDFEKREFSAYGQNMLTDISLSREPVSVNINVNCVLESSKHIL